MRRPRRQTGFTLIELSIVLTVIGLLIGGILTAQDVIRAARINATIAKVQKYHTAVIAFDTKYNAIPGDLNFNLANSYNLNPPAGALISGGDGNGLIESSGADKAYFLGEPVLFWWELSAAGLINGTYGSQATTSGALAANITSIALANAYMPPTKLGQNSSINVVSGNHTNYFLISGFGSGTITAATGAYADQTNPLTPFEAYSIDIKIDDGLPGSGSVQAMNTAVPLVQTSITSPAPVPACVTSAYYVRTGNLPACSLLISFADPQ